MFVFGEYVGSLIVGDNVKTPFSVIDGKSGMAEAELIILFGQLGKDGLQVKCISRSGALVKEVFFFFAVFGRDAVRGFAVFIKKDFFPTRIKT